MGTTLPSLKKTWDRKLTKDPVTGRIVPTVFTVDQDQIIRDCWATAKWNRTAAYDAAKRTGLSYSCCERRAMVLGVYAHSPLLFRHNKWKDKETEILELGLNNLWTLLKIKIELERKGFRRTVTAISDRIDKDNIRARRTGMCKQELAVALGIGLNTLEKWRREGLIEAERLPCFEYDRVFSNGDRTGQIGRVSDLTVPWNYTRREIRRFIFDNPGMINLKRVQPAWFMDLMTNIEKLEHQKPLRKGRRYKKRKSKLFIVRSMRLPLSFERRYHTSVVPVMRINVL